MNRRNYQRELDHVIEEAVREERAPSLLLHACCAPCSSYCLEYLSRYFEITVFYYNPNIAPLEEYQKRAEELEGLIRKMETVHPVKLLTGAYEPERFLAAARGLEQEPEGGRRCTGCFGLRLGEAVKAAEERQMDYVTTTLTISPLKDPVRLNEIGETLCRNASVRWLPSDFKKKNGYKRSVELSEQYGLYRQNYCGCVFSREQG